MADPAIRKPANSDKARADVDLLVLDRFPLLVLPLLVLDAKHVRRLVFEHLQHTERRQQRLGLGRELRQRLQHSAVVQLPRTVRAVRSVHHPQHVQRIGRHETDRHIGVSARGNEAEVDSSDEALHVRLEERLRQLATHTAVEHDFTLTASRQLVAQRRDLGDLADGVDEVEDGAAVGEVAELGEARAPMTLGNPTDEPHEAVSFT